MILDGIRVADFTWGLSGPATTQMLGDLGADVIKIEGPFGDDQRGDRGASKAGATPAGFVAYNRNKRSITLDLKTEAGRVAAQRIAANSDILIQNFRTGVMARFGLDYETLSTVNGSLIYCSISGYGSQGPLSHKAANDIAVQARSGMMSITGYPGQEPVRAHGYPADLTTSIYTALGALAALHYRDVTGLGQHVEVSMVGSVMSLLGRVYGEYLVDGYVPPPLGSGSDMGTPNGAFPTKDGWITMSAVPDNRWQRACQALGLTHLLSDPRFGNRADRRAHRTELIALISEATAKLTKREAETALEEYGVSCSPVYTIPEAAADPSLRRYFVDVPVSGQGTAANVRFPVDFSKAPASITHPVPRIGEHGAQILREYGFTEAEIAETLGTTTGTTTD